MVIRYHLSRLANRRWLYLATNATDKRSKDIFLTTKTLQKFQTIEIEIANLLKNSAASKQDNHRFHWRLFFLGRHPPDSQSRFNF
jgi:hypothetical protein